MLPDAKCSVPQYMQRKAPLAGAGPFLNSRCCDGGQLPGPALACGTRMRPTQPAAAGRSWIAYFFLSGFGLADVPPLFTARTVGAGRRRRAARLRRGFGAGPLLLVHVRLRGGAALFAGRTVGAGRRRGRLRVGDGGGGRERCADCHRKIFFHEVLRLNIAIYCTSSTRRNCSGR